MIIKKHDTQSGHAKKRFKERYKDVDDDRILANYILTKIRSAKKSKLLLYDPKTERFTYKVHHRKKTYVVVVDKHKETIITYLPEDAHETSDFWRKL